MALKPFEFQEQFMIDTFLLKVTQFEEKKTGSISILFYFLIEFTFLLAKKMNWTSKDIKNPT